jgi:hypothetical protein
MNRRTHIGDLSYTWDSNQKLDHPPGQPSSLGLHLHDESQLGFGQQASVDCLEGLSEVIGKERDRKLEAARKLRQEKRAATKQVA